MKQINQVIVLVIGMLIGAMSPMALAAQGAASDTAAVVVASVNINTATAEELAAQLEGVGKKKAADIVEYRETHGPFKSAGELADVKGVGKGILQRNANRIVVE